MSMQLSKLARKIAESAILNHDKAPVDLKKKLSSISKRCC